MQIYLWLIWYVWKAKNNKLYSNIDRKPLDIVTIAIAEENAWETAQFQENSLTHTAATTRPTIHNRVERCQVDGPGK